ncbi:hypothetical protein M0802_014599 [Mischocyttarus mexicanus]|nr:hypothetical protein M0802_014599 [Mischocyttarus mexicanus]
MEIEQLEIRVKLLQVETTKHQQNSALMIEKLTDELKLLKSRSQDDVTHPMTNKEIIEQVEKKYKDYYARNLELNRNNLIKALESCYNDYKNKFDE